MYVHSWRVEYIRGRVANGRPALAAFLPWQEMAFRTTVLNKRFYAVSTQDELWKPHFEAVMAANGFPAHHSYLLSGFYQLCVLATAQGVRLGRPNTRPCRHQVQGLRPNAQGTPRGRAGCPPGNIADTIAHDIPPVHAYNLPNPCWYVCWAVEATSGTHVSDLVHVGTHTPGRVGAKRCEPAAIVFHHKCFKLSKSGTDVWLKAVPYRGTFVFHGHLVRAALQHARAACLCGRASAAACVWSLQSIPSQADVTVVSRCCDPPSKQVLRAHVEPLPRTPLGTHPSEVESVPRMQFGDWNRRLFLHVSPVGRKGAEKLGTMLHGVRRPAPRSVVVVLATPDRRPLATRRTSRSTCRAASRTSTTRPTG